MRREKEEKRPKSQMKRALKQSLEEWGEDKPTFIQKILGMIKKPRMTVIGLAHLLKTICNDKEIIQTMIIPSKGAK